MRIANFSRLTSKTASDSLSEFRLYYDRRVRGSPVPSDLEEYVTGSHTLYMRQVPSASTLKKASGKLIPSVIAHKMGLRLPKWETIERSTSEESKDPEDGINPSTANADEWEQEEDPNWDTPTDTVLRHRKYSDPWKIMAGYGFSEQYMQEKPEILVWPGGHRRIQDRVPQRLFGSERKGMTMFTSCSNVDERLYLIRVHTHWGHALARCRMGASKIVEAPFAKSLWRRVSRFLRGYHDPLWNKDELSRFWVDTRPRKPAARAQRLLEVLKTIDGLFLQRFLAFPEEVWTWDKYDQFVIQSLSFLITDEFFDGEVNASVLEETLFYEELKRARKQAKLAFHTQLDAEYRKLESCPRWICTLLLNTWKYARRMAGPQFVELAGLLSQTRGCGTPPALTLLKSKKKFLMGIQQEPKPLDGERRQLLLRAMNGFIRKLPEYVFTGLGTKARVTVTGSACAEATRKMGGTSQAILEILEKRRTVGIPIRDLQTGETLRFQETKDFDSIGTAIFYACLDEVLWTFPEELRTVHLTMVKEPGKGRVVTKGHAALKVVLDTISRICSFPLKKVVKSSESGMGRSHHGWNLFLDLFKEEDSEMLFSVKEKTSEEFSDHVIQTLVFDDLYFASTDYSEATDALQHSVARPIAENWMVLCGIPPLLRGIVHGVCFEPRTVLFSGTGPLKDVGTEVEGDIRSVPLRVGVLMGDPLTKPVLHLVNILVRSVPQLLSTGELLQGRNQAEALQESARIFGGPN